MTIREIINSLEAEKNQLKEENKNLKTENKKLNIEIEKLRKEVEVLTPVDPVFNVPEEPSGKISIDDVDGGLFEFEKPKRTRKKKVEPVEEPINND